MGYHKRKIEKGQYGEFSKIKEEFEELDDAVFQEDKILTLCELTDLIGAIEAYGETLGVSIFQLLMFALKTKESFKEGKR